MGTTDNILKVLNGELVRDLLLINEGVYDPSIFKVFFLAGGPGSGKSFVTQKVTPGMGLKIINSDTILTKQMKKAKLSLDFMNMSPADAKKRDKIRDRAKELTARQLQGFIKGRLGVVIDGTGKDYEKIKRQRQMFVDMGYDAYIIFINTTLDVALERNRMRARKVPEDIVKTAWQSVHDNLGKFQSLFGADNLTVIDNSDARDIPDKVLNAAWKKVKLASARQPENEIARAWIRAELEKRRKTESADIDEWLDTGAIQFEATEGAVFDIEDVEKAVELLNMNIRAPHVYVYSSALGGPEHVTILIGFSLDPKPSWKHGILENSRYVKLYFANDGVITWISSGTGLKKWRKTRTKSLDDAIKKINTWIKGVK